MQEWGHQSTCLHLRQHKVASNNISSIAGGAKQGGITHVGFVSEFHGGQEGIAQRRGDRLRQIIEDAVQGAIDAIADPVVMPSCTILPSARTCAIYCARQRTRLLIEEPSRLCIGAGRV